MRIQNKATSGSGLTKIVKASTTIELPSKDTIVKSSTYTNIQFVKG